MNRRNESTDWAKLFIDGVRLNPQTRACPHCGSPIADNWILERLTCDTCSASFDRPKMHGA